MASFEILLCQHRAGEDLRILPGLHTSPLLLALVGTLLAAFGGAAPLSAPRGPATTLASCPLFLANNIWNTDISKLSVDKHNSAWLRR